MARMLAPVWTAYLDGMPVLYNHREAWIHTLAGKWVPADRADVMHNASVVSRAAFDKLFPGLPKLPEVAFSHQI